MSSALREFAERGYDGASTEKIVRRAGVKKPTLYYYFGSKAGLFRALLDRAYEQGVEFLRDAAAPSLTIDRKLFRIASSVLKFTRTHPDLVRLTFLRVTMPPRELAKIKVRDIRYRKGFELLASLLQEGIRTGELADAFTAYELAIAFAGPLNAIIIRYLRGESGPLSDRAAQRIVEVFMHGASPRNRARTAGIRERRSHGARELDAGDRFNTSVLSLGTAQKDRRAGATHGDKP